jgi:hypothetical protein
MLEYVLEMTSFKSQTFLIYKELQQWETIFQISYNIFHMIFSLYKIPQ